MNVIYASSYVSHHVANICWSKQDLWVFSKFYGSPFNSYVDIQPEQKDESLHISSTYLNGDASNN